MFSEHSAGFLCAYITFFFSVLFISRFSHLVARLLLTEFVLPWVPEVHSRTSSLRSLLRRLEETSDFPDAGKGERRPWVRGCQRFVLRGFRSRSTSLFRQTRQTPLVSRPSADRSRSGPRGIFGTHSKFVRACHTNQVCAILLLHVCY